VVAGISVDFAESPGKARRLVAAALVASAILLVPSLSHAGIIASWSPERSGSGLIEQELSSLDELDYGLSSGTSPAEPNHAPHEKSPAEKQRHGLQDDNLLAATDCAGGTTNSAPSRGMNVGSMGLAKGSATLAPIQVCGFVFFRELVIPLSPLPDGLLDPPRVSR
jgi:hypothetical protein